MSNTDLNVALAVAIGWTPAIDKRFQDMPNGTFTVSHGGVYCKDTTYSSYSMKFDYRNPVISMALVKHYKMIVSEPGRFAHSGPVDTFVSDNTAPIEKIIAMAAIKAVNHSKL